MTAAVKSRLCRRGRQARVIFCGVRPSDRQLSRLGASYHLQVTHLLDVLRGHLRSSLRLLVARPGWTLAAMSCLAIATGANTAAFTIVNGLLLRPLPFDDPDRLVMVALRDPQRGSARPFALREYRHMAESSQPAGALLARTFFPVALAAEGEQASAQMAEAELVSGNYFEVLSVPPFLGRFFDQRADRPSAAVAAVLSHRLWQQRFDANPSIAGRTIRVNGRSAIVTGVAPPGFVGAMQLVAADLWLPAATYPALAGSARADAVPMFGVMGRLAAGITVDEAQVRLTAVAASLPRDGPGNGPLSVVVKKAGGFAVPVAVEGAVLTISGFIYGMMILLMAVACANVAALVLARGVGRSREIAVRLSLGATRWHVAGQLLIESLVLAVAGCAVGIVLAIWLTQALLGRLATPFHYVTFMLDVHPDGRVFAYSAAVTVATALLCGIAPIRLAGRVDVIEVIKRSGAGGRSRAAMRTLNGMVVLQLAVSTTLLVVAGMLVRTYVQAQSSHPNFNTDRLVIAALDLDQVHMDRRDGVRLYEALLDRLSAVPGVVSVGLTSQVPLSTTTTIMVSANRGPASERLAAAPIIVSSQFLPTLGLTLLQGRWFEPGETAGRAIVNEAMARRLWPDMSPIGQTFLRHDREGRPTEVIGVVADLEKPAPRRSGEPAFYVAFPGEYAARLTVVARAARDPATVFANVRESVRALHRDLAIVDLRAMDDLLAAAAHQRKIPATVLTVVASLGLLLSAVGLYGVVAYAVRERTRELGIRLALGASPRNVRRMIVRQGITLAALGLTGGLAGAAALGPLLQNRVFGAASIDAALIFAVGGVLMAVSLLALYLPARLASSVEPAQTLRRE